VFITTSPNTEMFGYLCRISLYRKQANNFLFCRAANLSFALYWYEGAPKSFQPQKM